MAPFLTPLVELGAMSFQLCSLRHDQRVTGLLCTGHAQPPEEPASPGTGVTEFADRLSVVLANHERLEQLHREATLIL